MSELGESVEEAGLKIKIESLLGIYSKYYHTYLNGDRIQMCSVFFIAKIIDGRMITENDETAQLKYFSKYEINNIFHKQHLDAINDFFSGRRYVFL